jgi:hypothetical protein
MATTPVNRARVIAACENFLMLRTKQVQAKREQMIAKVMLPRGKLFWLFQLPTLTRDQAIKLLKRDREGYYSSWQEPEIRGSLWVEKAEKLLNLCNAADQFVGLSTDDIWILEHEPT